MSNADRAPGGRRGPLLVLALVLAAGVALLAVEHQRAARSPPTLAAPADRLAPPVAGGGALPVRAPAPAR